MTPQRVVLREYETKVVELDSLTAAQLLAAAGEHLTLTPTAERDRFAVTASQYVGAVVLPEIEVLVRPKVRPENLFLLLDVGLPEQAWATEQVGLLSSDRLLPAMATFFARAADAALGRGTLRSYRTQRDRLPALRGRIDLRELIRQPGVAVPIACEYDEYDEDIAENQVLKAAAGRLLRIVGVRPVVRRMLLGTMARLEDVSEVAVDPSTIDRIHITRLNAHYEPALRLARLILRNLTLADQFGSTGAHAFFVDMNDLFQRFVTDRLERALRRRLQLVPEPPEFLGEHHQVSMRPDLVFRRVGLDVYVADVKYKLTWSGFGKTADYYQLLAYTTALGLPEGALIYCQAGDEAVPREVVARGSGKRLVSYAVDLTGPADTLEAGVVKVADSIVARASASLSLGSGRTESSGKRM